MNNSLECKAIKYLWNLNTEIYEKDYVVNKLIKLFNISRENSIIIYNKWRKEYIRLRDISKE